MEFIYVVVGIGVGRGIYDFNIFTKMFDNSKIELFIYVGAGLLVAIDQVKKLFY